MHPVPPVSERVSQQRITRELERDRLVIRRRWGAWWYGAAVLFLAAWMGWGALQGAALFYRNSVVPWWLERLLLGCAAVGLAYASVALMLNSTELEATREHLRVRRGPVPWGRAVGLVSAEIRVVSFRENAQKGYATNYDLVAIDGGGEWILISGLNNYEVTIFYVRELRDFLRLPYSRIAPLV